MAVIRGVDALPDGSFEAIPALDTLKLMLLFRRLLENLLGCGRIGQATLDRFHHPGFSAYEGQGVSPEDGAAVPAARP